MKKIIAIGNSIAAVAALEEIRRRDKESELTLFCEENHLPYNRLLFGDVLSKTVAEDKIFYKPAAFYKEQNIVTVLGRRITRLDFKKNRVVTEGKEQLSFDALLIAYTGQEKFPEIKGTNKVGTFGLRRLSDVKDILSILHLVEIAVVQGGNIESLKFAEGLRKRGKDVLLVVPSSKLLSASLDGTIEEKMVKYLEENGVRVIKENSVAEILGEGEVKAVRLSSGKVLAAQMAIFGDTLADLKFFNDSPLEKERGIFIDGSFKTNLEGVFAVDAAAQKRNAVLSFATVASLEEEGRVAGLNIAGEKTVFSPSLAQASLKLFAWTLDLKEQPDGSLQGTIEGEEGAFKAPETLASNA